MITFRNVLRSAVLVSFGAVVLNIGRLGLSEFMPYLWLNWNLLLALVPLFFAWSFMVTHNAVIKLISFLLWLGFLPNAPYIITDFIHMADVGPRSILWYDGVMIFLYTLAGIIVWVGSTYLIQKHAQWNEWFIVIIGVLSGFGLYLGRYIRFNTWDVITNPLPLLQTVSDIFVHPQNHQPVMLITGVIAFIFIILFKLIPYHEKTNN
jgi:uncharacterized membrane protein